MYAPNKQSLPAVPAERSRTSNSKGRSKRRCITKAALVVIQRKRLEAATWVDKCGRRIMQGVSTSEEGPLPR